jgi:hypothetical protein
MKIIIGIVILLVVLFFMAETKISTNPFKIQFNNLGYAIGFSLILTGIVIIRTAEYKKGLDRGLEITIEVIKELKDEN